MKTKNIDDISKNLNDLVKSKDLKIEEYKQKLLESVYDLNVLKEKTKKNEKIASLHLLILFTILIFLLTFTVITYTSQDDLQKNLTEQSKIIGKYENIVKKSPLHSSEAVYRDEKGNKITVQSLLDDNMRLMQKLSDAEGNLDLIKQRYGIDIIDNGKTFEIRAAKVDSGLFLLDVYRDKIKYNPVKKQWVINRTYIDTAKVKR